MRQDKMMSPQHRDLWKHDAPMNLKLSEFLMPVTEQIFGLEIGVRNNAASLA